MAYDVPVLISRQSGVAEVVRNAIKVDFWENPGNGEQDLRDLVVPVSRRRGSQELPRGAQDHPLGNVADRLNAVYEQLVSGGK